MKTATSPVDAVHSYRGGTIVPDARFSTGAFTSTHVPNQNTEVVRHDHLFVDLTATHNTTFK